MSTSPTRRPALVALLRRLRLLPPEDASRIRQAGQVLPIFAIMSVVLLGGAALLTDVAWWWTNEQRMQRAADAAALAGAVFLPGNQSGAYNAAHAEARKNGYVSGVDGVVITPRRDPANPRKLIVDIDGPVGTNFARVFCWQGGPCLDSVDVGVTGAAEFVLPVPMGSPQNYYGVGRLVDEVTRTVTTLRNADTGSLPPFAFVAGGQWQSPQEAFTDDEDYASETDNGHVQVWREFRAAQAIPDSNTLIQGIQVQLDEVQLTGSGTSTNCRVDVELSWDGGNTWSSTAQTSALPTTEADRDVGSTSDTTAWGLHAWTRNDLTDANFQVRLRWRDGVSGCAATRGVRFDRLEVRVFYRYDDVTTTTTIEEVDVNAPDGSGVLAPQNFWGALQSQGAPNIQGDAYMTYYNTRTSVTNNEYSSTAYYQYAIEIPAGSSSGEVWLFDPGFCQVDSNKGTGEYYTQGGTNGSSGYNPVSTFYQLWDTHDSPYYAGDDTSVYDSGSTYQRLRLYDSDLGSSVSGWSQCDSLAWHNGWVRIANGLAAGTYRLHTYSTDPGSATDQRNTTALNAFAIWAKASGGTPRVYGLGAMESYFPLPAGSVSEFYLAQIDAEHAGKTMVVSLWDPGDTGSLVADLQILEPRTNGYFPVAFNYTARRNSGNASNCDSRAGNGVTSIRTNTGGTSLYNGCWVTIEIQLPDTYSAPHPSTDTVTTESGWWKIRYIMGSGTNPSTDLTTWQVELRGNPVHLVPE